MLPKSSLRIMLRAALTELISALDGPAAPTEMTADPLPKTTRRLLAATTRTPATGKKICRLAGLAYNSHTRKTFAAMVRAGIITRTPDGYFLT